MEKLQIHSIGYVLVVAVVNVAGLVKVVYANAYDFLHFHWQIKRIFTITHCMLLQSYIFAN